MLGAGDGSRPSYRRHEPENTVLYQVVSQNLETFLEEVRVSYEKPLPGYVEKELRDYLRCGILAAASRGSTATGATDRSWWPSAARREARVQAATQGECATVRRSWSITSSQTYLCGNGFSAYPSNSDFYWPSARMP